ncbi:uncharacterized protein PV07_08690 [Cladophialophora immunda]|uniref:Uncharacterized protein n=1 Tax=Cladophialophora immunda TaxID=569365 RepID=A0A0D2CPQ6_9EURO|nr:uncharacterized protein PV07_08690 [Cladophialophora immunda]KIW25524.1 hypothetical protein PV07_08690 [Cladophialophora immunda]
MTPTQNAIEEAEKRARKAVDEEASEEKEKERKLIPRPRDRVTYFVAQHEYGRTITLREIEMGKASKVADPLPYPGPIPCLKSLSWIGSGCLKEFFQWLHRFDFTQDDEYTFSIFLCGVYDTLRIFRIQTQPDPLYFDPDTSLMPMNAAGATTPDKNEEFMDLIHEFDPALQVERGSNTEEEPVLPLRFGLPVGRVINQDPYYTVEDGVFGVFHMVFHPIDKSFWLVRDRYLGMERFTIDDPEEEMKPQFEEVDNQTRRRWLSVKFGEQNHLQFAEAFRLGTADLWFPEGLGLSELDAGERLPRFNDERDVPTIDFSRIPSVPLFPDDEPLQVHYARRSDFMSYLGEHRVAKGCSWLSVSLPLEH